MKPSTHICGTGSVSIASVKGIAPQASVSQASKVSKPAFASCVSKLRDTSRIEGPGLVR
ncbi:hypothetical protein ACVWZ3_007324 [Bradyrhizobium sp. i1.3.6]